MHRQELVKFLIIVAVMFIPERGWTMELTSPNFENNMMIPQEFTCQGEDISPELHIAGIPENTQELVLIVDDPDAPVGTWIHWVVYGITPRDVIRRGEIPGIQGVNDFQRMDYGGPCPPSGTHRYFFKVYALGAELNLAPGLSKSDVLKAIEGHVLEKAELIGLYKKQ